MHNSEERFVRSDLSFPGVEVEGRGAGDTHTQEIQFRGEKQQWQVTVCKGFNENYIIIMVLCTGNDGITTF